MSYITCISLLFLHARLIKHQLLTCDSSTHCTIMFHLGIHEHTLTSNSGTLCDRKKMKQMQAKNAWKQKVMWRIPWQLARATKLVCGIHKQNMGFHRECTQKCLKKLSALINIFLEVSVLSFFFHQVWCSSQNCLH